MTGAAAVLVSHGGLGVRVEAGGEALAWLAEFLAPSLAVGPPAPAAVTVASRFDAAAFAALRARGPRPDGAAVGSFVFDAGLVMLPRWSAATGETIAFEEEGPIFYRRAAGGATVELLGERERPSQRIRLLRAVREYFVGHAWGAGETVVHGAALTAGGLGIAIAGAKGAGKTTLLLLLLRAGAAGLVANDRIVLAAGADRVAARGIPTVVQIRRPPAGALPQLADWLRDAGADHRLPLAAAGPRSAPRDPDAAVQFSPAQFAALAEVPLCASAPLDVLLFPRVEPRAAGLVLAPLPAAEAAARLRRCVWGGQRPPLSELFVPPDAAPAPDPAALDAACATLAGRLRAFECRLGRAADQPAVARRALAHLAGR